MSPLAMLAGSMRAHPGVSARTNLLTRWRVATDLVRWIVTIEDPASIEDAYGDPEKWWHHRQGESLGYSSLLETAPTPATRRGLLADFIEPSGE